MFSVSWYLNLAPLPQSWPTPSWDQGLGRLGPLQTGLRPPLCLLHPHRHPQLSMLHQGSNYSEGGGEVRRAFHIWKGELGQTHSCLLLSDVRHCPGAALCLAHLLPLCNPGRAARGSTRSTLFSALTGTSKGNCLKTGCSWWGWGWGRGWRQENDLWHWGNSYSFLRFQIKLCFSSNRLNGSSNLHFVSSTNFDNLNPQCLPLL